ncbi:copper resistance system multicopper oxidase [Sphingopyxis lindanitolerans]|uniref:Copper resistance system multicopper oxidase n=1 Tax=Sphingopyxis lindanitolerans TaxID=2054227 RepID=A0A2S8B3H0_9SPHN|nr:copper resistance system multicopper oxidase [Sphingopyxis lindanitolerans]PQM26890.1 copper resistance system multicopper oxidase [Sphingopyxis lindanitolerans]
MQINRRRFVGGALGGGGVAAMAAWFPAWAQPVSSGITAPIPTVSGSDITLRIARQTMRVDGRLSRAIGINGTVPAPLVRLKEGQTARLTVVNDLDEDSSIHWHGLLLPFQMDGVPGVSFPGIKPRSTFIYEFPVIQSGTYWYHSHSGLQEQIGHYGPIVIDPEGTDPVVYDREHVVVLSDHSHISPEAIFHKLKANPGHFNGQRQTLAGLLAGKDQPLDERIAWGAMRMDPTDVADVSGSTYTFLVNGHGPRDNWTALFNPGERVRLRIINASAMSIFNVRIPGLRMTVVQADGLNIVPVETDEFQIAVAETYDVIVTPAVDRAYTFVAEANDRSGMGRATLAPRPGMTAEVPPLRSRPLATMKDMGMGAMGAGAGGDASCSAEHAAMGHCTIEGDGGAMDHGMRDFDAAPQVKRDPSVQTISPMPVDRMGEPGQGLDDVGHEVLTYKQLVALDRNPDVRAPERSLDIHLTGNMERFMWSFDGMKMSDHHEPIPFIEGERVRVNLINDTMMSHPIHLHGHFFELVTGKGDRAPRKHTVLVQPGGIATFDLTADAVGDWAFHCHLLYHMYAGMMRVVSVRPRGEAA